MEIKQILISALNPAGYNPRKISDKMLAKLAANIKEFGFVLPVVVNEDMTIIGGHQRVKAAKMLDMVDVPCVIMKLSKAREKVLNVSLNKIEGEFDEKMLIELLAEIEIADHDLTGFEAKAIEKMLQQQEQEDAEDIVDNVKIETIQCPHCKEFFKLD